MKHENIALSKGTPYRPEMRLVTPPFISYLLIALAACGSPLAAQTAPSTPATQKSPEAKAFDTDHIFLYQADAVLKQRVSSVNDLAAYIQSVEKACAEYFAGSETAKTGDNLQIVIAVRPNKRSRVWFISARNAGHELDSLKKKLEAVEPFEGRSGPVAVAIVARIHGGTANGFGDENAAHPPIPSEWTEAIKDQKPPFQLPDTFLEAVWPDKEPS